MTDHITTMLDRFANPFLDHRLADIARNHAEKQQRQIGAFLIWARANGVSGPKPRLESALKGDP